MVVNFKYMHLNLASYFRATVLLLGFLSTNISFGQAEDLKREIEKIILHDTEIELEKTPGFEVGVIS